ncbi:MAG: RNA 2',3'-cyclic phosphodiesterase [Cyclonatronaceae bacterium]
MRLFTAIALPDFARTALADLQPQHPDIRLTPQSQIHMTLRYIGETDKVRTRRVVQALAHVTFRPFDIELMGTGCFPNPKEPAVLWAGVRYHPVLRELYDSMQEELYRSGIQLSDRTFHPHITLGRIRRGKKERARPDSPPLQSVVDRFLNGEPSSFHITFPVDRFRLYQSRLHSGGAIHQCLQEYMATSMEL